MFWNLDKIVISAPSIVIILSNAFLNIHISIAINTSKVVVTTANEEFFRKND